MRLQERQKDDEVGPERPGRAPAARAPQPQPSVGDVLALQRSAGNAAVAALMRSTLARHGDHDHEGEGPEPASGAGGTATAAPPAPKATTPPAGSNEMVHIATEAMAGKRDKGVTAGRLMWMLLAEHLPGEGRKLSGSLYEAKVGAEPLFDKDPARLPMMQAGDKLLTMVAGNRLGEAGLEIKGAMDKVDEHRVKNKLVDAEDLKKPSLVKKLKDLDETEKSALMLTTKDEAVRAFVKNLGISTPVPTASARQPDGSVTGTINGMAIVILPDEFGGTQSQTTVTPKRDPEKLELKYTTKGGKIETFTPNPVAPKLTFTIKTTYKTGEGPDMTSGYGKGTTDADKAAGKTTLGYHEGSHGTDYLTYISANPYPVFAGKVGDTKAVFDAAMKSWNDATRQWHNKMNQESKEKTDCVGTPTIDDAHKGEAGYVNICKK